MTSRIPTAGNSSAGSRKIRIQTDVASAEKRDLLPSMTDLSAGKPLSPQKHSNSDLLKLADEAKSTKEDEQPINLPPLWVRDHLGKMVLLDAPVSAERATGRKYGDVANRRKSKFRNRMSMQIDLSKDKPNRIISENKPRKTSKPIYNLQTIVAKQLSDEDRVASVINILPPSIKISSDHPEKKDLKPEELEKALSMQSLEEDRQNVKRQQALTKNALAAKRHEELQRQRAMRDRQAQRERKRLEAIRSRQRSAPSEEFIKSQWMHHIVHPQSMGPLFSMPLLEQLMFGPYATAVKDYEKGKTLKAISKGVVHYFP